MTVENHYGEAVFQKMYTAAQMLWWLVVYDEQFENWGKDDQTEAIEFSDNMTKQSRRLPKSPKQLQPHMKFIVAKTGIDPIKEAHAIEDATMFAIMPCEGDYKVYRRYANHAFCSGIFLGLWTLYNVYQIRGEDLERYYDEYLMALTMFYNGMTFEELEDYWQKDNDLPIIWDKQ